MNLIEHYVQATILETIKQPIFIEDIYGVYVYCNQAFADFMEQPIDRIVKRADTKNLQSRLAETASLSKTSDVKISLNKSILYGTGQKIIGYVGTVQIESGFLIKNVQVVNKLTEREVEIINLLARGCSVKTIAKLLNISPHTVADHLKSIYRKLNVHSKSEAIYKAISLFVTRPE